MKKAIFILAFLVFALICNAQTLRFSEMKCGNDIYYRTYTFEVDNSPQPDWVVEKADSWRIDYLFCWHDEEAVYFGTWDYLIVIPHRYNNPNIFSK